MFQKRANLKIKVINPIYYGGDVNGSNSKKIRENKKRGLKALKDKLGATGMIKFLQMYGDGK